MKFSDESYIYKIMGIDNGSSMLGMVIVLLDLRLGHYHVVDKATFVAEKLLNHHTGTVTSHGARWARQNTIQDCIRRELRYHNPHAVAVETPFFMPRRVQSFETLTEMMIFIRIAVDDWSGQDIFRVTPGEAKRAVQPKDKSVKFTMKKVVIKDCVLALPNLSFSEEIDKANLTEHEYDAIAVAIHHGENIRRENGFLRK